MCHCHCRCVLLTPEHKMFNLFSRRALLLVYFAIQSDVWRARTLFFYNFSFSPSDGMRSYVEWFDWWESNGRREDLLIFVFTASFYVFWFCGNPFYRLTASGRWEKWKSIEKLIFVEATSRHCIRKMFFSLHKHSTFFRITQPSLVVDWLIVIKASLPN